MRGHDQAGEHLRRRNVGRRLTDRQAALLRYVADGLENKQIAQHLGIAEQTVKEQISNLLRRLAVRNRAELAEIATEMRIFGTTVDETWLPQLFTEAPFGIALIRGPDLRVELTNAYYRRHVGERDPAGKTLREAFPEWAPEAYALFERVYASGEPFSAHEYAARWDRTGRGPEEGYADFAIQPLRDQRGEVNGLLVMYVDVTELVRERHERGGDSSGEKERPGEHG
ncbi:MAG TPA: LuxR C-terminal-related transcriptional regulator [Candidatus Limnocylindria bacterium]|jgi:DNA-binding CsgD family transcriptional regulator|nr:LuxR C-terminal-related transcriptional regulator [Candidatus Limnocylindria bacterium]